MEAFLHERSDGDWRNYAVCRKYDPEDFFPEKSHRKKIEAVKLICGACAVRLECLDFAETSKSYYGVWGGLSEQERENERAKVKKRASGLFLKDSGYNFSDIRLKWAWNNMVSGWAGH